jgi:hypothetical protein
VRSNVVLSTVVILVGWALTLWGFWPGWMSFDSSDQYAQVLSGRYNDVHPPLMAAIWALTNRVVPGPGGIFALHALAFWIGLVATLAFRFGGWRLAAIALGIGIWPPIALMTGHVWKDVGMTAALLIATAAALHWRRDGNRYFWALAFTALLVAAAYRHNAIAACLPLLALLFRRDAGRRWSNDILGFVMAALALFVAPSLIARAIGAEHKLAWPAVALFDIAAVSIATDQQRVPPEISAPSLTVGDLRAHFKPWANPSVFETGKIKLSFFVPYGPRERNAVATAWWRAIREQPRAWVAHRARLSGYLLFGPPAQAPRELVIAPMMALPPDADLQLMPADNILMRKQIAFADRWWRSPVFWAAPYLLLSLVIAFVVWRNPQRWQPALILCASAWANALPLALIAGAAEARYLLWTQIIALIAAACVFIPARRHHPSP